MTDKTLTAADGQFESMPRKNAALILLLVGLVLLPGPAYAIGLERLDAPDRSRSPTGYVARPIDGANDTALTERYGDHVSLQVEDLRFSHVADDFRAPNRTRDVLEAVTANETVHIDDAAVQSDLGQVSREYPFVTREYETYYRLRLSERDGATRVEAVPATDAEVAAVVRDRLVTDYAELSPAQRRTFEAIRNATTSDESYAYRPWSDEPLPPTPVVRRDGTYYAVRGVMHVDDFSLPDGFVAGFVASGVGALCLLAAVALAVYRRVVAPASGGSAGD